MRIKNCSWLLALSCLLTALCSLLFANSGCGKRKTEPVKPTEKVSEVAKVVVPEPKTKPIKEKKVVYVYQGHRFRDPFIPLTGETAGVSRTKRGVYLPNLRSLVLKGIIEDAGGLIALIIDGEGKNFILKEGKLVDPEGKIVPGISGIIKEGKIIFSSGQTKVELKLKEAGK